jgi:benzoate membrane transport protein
MHFSIVSSALVATLVGFAGTLALVVSAAQAVGATPAQTVSLITAISAVKALGPLLGSLAGAMQHEAHRYPAVLTFAVTASGVSFFGIGAAFWGLAAGLGALGIDAALRALRTARTHA